MTSQIPQPHILLFGASGSLGRAIFAEARAREIPCSIDLRDLVRMPIPELAQAIGHPRYAMHVINCAALNGIDPCALHKLEAYEINTIWPQKLAIVCEQIGLPCLHFSTEAVFRGDYAKRMPHDACDPKTTYGKSKRYGEHSCVWRLPLLFGPTHGKQIVARMVRAVLRGEKPHVADDVFSTPVYSPDLARLVLDHRENWGGSITHVHQAPLMSLHQLVFYICNACGWHEPILIGKSSAFPAFEPKPLNLGLAGGIELPQWKASVIAYAEWIQQNKEKFLAGD